MSCKKMDQKVSILMEFRIEGKSISMLGRKGGYITVIDSDNMKDIVNEEVKEKIFGIAKEIQEELKIN